MFPESATRVNSNMSYYMKHVSFNHKQDSDIFWAAQNTHMLVHS